MKEQYCESTKQYIKHIWDEGIIPFMKNNRITKIESSMGSTSMYRKKKEIDVLDELYDELEDVVYSFTKGTPLEYVDISHIINYK